MNAPTSDVISGPSRVQALYDDGQFLSAWEALQAHQPVERWTSTRERILLARVLSQLGGGRRSRREFLRAYRQAPEDPEACLYQAMTLLQRWGPLAARRFMDARGELAGSSEEQRADWLLTRSNIDGALRDFEEAEHWQREAEALAPGHPWLWVQRSFLKIQQDAYGEAEEAARRSLELQPWYRPAVGQLGHLLQSQERDGEALALLEEASTRLQSPSILSQLAMLQGELGQHEASLGNLWRALELSVALDRNGFRWFARALSDAYYQLGDRRRATELSWLGGKEWGEKIAARMEAATEVRRVLLKVPFVRQHHVTCAPATLTSLSRFWSMPADHLGVAEEICYDGTPARSERKWAMDNGWEAREFTVDWRTAVALLERGVPFTLTTTETSSGHLQAVVGFDSARGTLLIRDPSHRTLGEGDAEALFKNYASTGPRGMAMVPKAQAPLLDGLELPDAALYDALHEIQLALATHDRVRAGAVHAQMAAQAPDHRLSIDATLALAGYDGDRHARLRCSEQLVSRFPQVPRLELHHASAASDLIPTTERVERLAALAARPKADPEVLLAYASELAGDGRRLAEAESLLRRALRKAPESARGYSTLARVREGQERREEALALYRAAATLAHRDEHSAWEYFRHAQANGRAEAGLAFLDDRFRRFGHKAPGPCQTLIRALESLDRGADALTVLELGLSRLPQSGDLKLEGLGARLRAGQVEKAAELLDAARGAVREVDWLRGAAELAAARLDFEAALARWREVLALDPLMMEANQQVCRLLTRGEGPQRALEHLAQMVDRFNHHVPLHEMYLSWVRNQDLPRAEKLARRLLELNPTDAWARRELAIALARQRRLDEALAELEVARQLDPASAATYGVHASVRELTGDLPGSRALYRESLRRDPDDSFSIHRLLGLCRTHPERLEELAFIERELDRCPLFRGEGVLAFQETAEHVLPPAALLERLRGWKDSKPGSWAVHAALTRQLVELGHLEEAAGVARLTVERFALLPGAWLDLALVHRVRKDAAAEEAALRRALELNPQWGMPARLLAALLQRQKATEQAREVLERAARHAAEDGEVHAELAEQLWAAGLHEPAMERLERALRVDGSLRAAWDRLQTWSEERGQPGRAAALARALAVSAPASPFPWQALAELTPAIDLGERLMHLGEALARSPRSVDLYDTRVRWLAEAGRFEEAKAACRPELFGANPPRELLAREAWVAWEQGAHAEALGQLRAVFEREPDFVWPALLLADWATERKEGALALEAARRLQELEPLSGRSFGYLGDAHRMRGERAEAMAAFERALELSPRYSFAFHSLFDLYMEAEELGRARALLERSGPHLEPGLVLARQVRWAIAAGEQGLAGTGLEQLLERAPEEQEAHREAIDALEKRGWSEAVGAALEAVGARQGSPLLGEHWGTFLGRHRSAITAWPRLRALRAQGELGEHATAAYLEAVGERRAKATVTWFIRFHRAVVERLPRVFGALTYALVLLGEHRWLLRLARGWKDRTGLESWMLANLVVAARTEGRRGLAVEFSEKALGLAETPMTRAHRVWLANHHALEGRAAESSSLLQGFELQESEELLRFVRSLTEAVNSTHTEGGAAAHAKLTGLQQDLMRNLGDPLWRRLWNEAHWRVARSEATWRGWGRWLMSRVITVQIGS